MLLKLKVLRKRGKRKTEGSQNMRSYPDELLKNKDLKLTF